MKKPATPCFNCTDRIPGCHSTCERYKDFKEYGNGYYKLIYENRTRYYNMEICERQRAQKIHELYRRKDGKKI